MVVKDPPRLFRVLVLAWVSVSTTFNIFLISFPHKRFPWQHYLQKKASKKRQPNCASNANAAMRLLTLLFSTANSLSPFMYTSQGGICSHCHRPWVPRTLLLCHRRAWCSSMPGLCALVGSGGFSTSLLVRVPLLCLHIMMHGEHEI